MANMNLPKPKSVKVWSIIIDPGHGGKDQGAQVMVSTGNSHFIGRSQRAKTGL
jgi:N-acetylmuramoyl-L-alanine amidase